MKSFQCNDAVNAVAFTPDDKIIIAGNGDGTIKLWDMETEESLTIQAHEVRVATISISPDALTLATGGDDQTIKLWNIRTGEYIKTLQGQNSWVNDTAISPDGRILASCSWNGIIKIWDMQSGECVKTLSHQPYERMNITGIRGLSEVEKSTLKALGAVENDE